MLPDKVLEHGSKWLQEELMGTGNLLCHTLRAEGFSRQEMFTALQDSHVLLGELDNRVRLAPGYDGVPPRLDATAPELAFLSTEGHGFGYTNGTLTTTGPFGNTNVLVVTGDITQLTDPRRHDNFGRLDKCAQDYLEELSVAVQTERGRNPEWFGTVREFVPDNTVYINKLEQEHQLAFKTLVLSKPELKQELDAYLEHGRCDLCDPKLAESLSPGLLWAGCHDTLGLDRHGDPVESFPPMFEVSCTLCHEQHKPADPGAVENSAEGTVQPAEVAEPARNVEKSAEAALIARIEKLAEAVGDGTARGGTWKVYGSPRLSDCGKWCGESDGGARVGEPVFCVFYSASSCFARITFANFRKIHTKTKKPLSLHTRLWWATQSKQSTGAKKVSTAWREGERGVPEELWGS